MSVANPFKSLVPFGAKDWQTLFGRDADLDLVLNRIHSGKCTLLFAGSGVGKTSFLRAKLIPELESRNFICYTIAGVSGRRWRRSGSLLLFPWRVTRAC